MQKTPATFKTEGLGEDTVAIFHISNKDEKIKGQDVENWFKAKGIGCPSYKMTSDKQIELRIKCDPLKQEDQANKPKTAQLPKQDVQAKKPEAAEQLKQVNITDTLALLTENNIALTSESILTYIGAWVGYIRYYYMVKINAGYDAEYLSSYCALFDGTTDGLEKVMENFGKDLPEDVSDETKANLERQFTGIWSDALFIYI